MKKSSKKPQVSFPTLWDNLPDAEGISVQEPSAPLKPKQKVWEKGLLLHKTNLQTEKDETSIFTICSLGITGNKDNYDFYPENVIPKIAAQEEAEARSKAEKEQQIISLLAEELETKTQKDRSIHQVKPILTRPFFQKYCYYSPLSSQDLQQNSIFFPVDKEVENTLIVYANTNRSTPFYVFATDKLVASDAWDKKYCLALYLYDNEGDTEINISDDALFSFRNFYKNLRPRVEKKDIFNYVYAVLHHPLYQQTFAHFLQSETPRIPFYADFWKWASWGRRLLQLHVNYKQLAPFPFEKTDKILPEASMDLADLIGLPEEFEPPKPKIKLRMLKDKAQIEIDSQTTLHNIPTNCYAILLGNRSPIEWLLEAHRELKNASSPLPYLIPYDFGKYKEQLIVELGQLISLCLEWQEIKEEMLKG